MKSVLVTGPVGELAEYVCAARRAGWEASEHPLLRITPTTFSRAELREGRYDWVCVASSNALPWLGAALREVPLLRTSLFAVVGPRTESKVGELGVSLAVGCCRDASELTETLLRRAPTGARILCPRGSLSDDLARRLRARGFDVDAPVAYASEPAGEPETVPETTAVFFASPSAVRAWHARGNRSARRIAIAIGRTTFDALHEETSTAFFDTISLPEPTPEAFAYVLGHLDPEATS